MSVSIEDVAGQAGVSVSTVSRALRGLSGVSESTRERVHRVAADLGYAISPSASRLATGRTRTVGVVAPMVNRWFFARVIAGAATVLREAGFDLLLFDLGDAEGRKHFFERPTLRGRVDAVLVLCLPLRDHEISVLKDLDVPVAVLGSQVPDLHSVGIDDLDGARTAMRHLVNLGHERIGMIGMSETGREVMHFPDNRRQGYLDVLADRELEADPQLEQRCSFGVEGGEDATSRLLAVDRLPTAIFVEFDEMAFGALRTLHRAGLRVPDDISVIGFDDHDMADLLGLTTVRQPVPEQGSQAALLLLDALESPGGAEPTEITMPTRLVIRDTTSPARTGPVTGRDQAGDHSGGAVPREPKPPLVR